MKLKIAAVVMVDADEGSRARAASDREAAKRLAAYRDLVADIVTASGGHNLPPADEAGLAYFESAVQAMRASVEIQETLRARNRGLPLAERTEMKLGLTIGEVAADGSEAAPDTLAGVAHLLTLAAPGGLCISRSVREAVASKLAIKFQDVSVEGRELDTELRSAYRVASERPAAAARKSFRLPTSLPVPRAALAGLAGLAIGAAVVAVATQILAPAPGGVPAVAPQAAIAPVPQSAPPGPTALAPERPKATPGKIEFLPSKAPDPASILTAARMLPKAWKDCQSANPSIAAAACKTLHDSGIPKDDELAQVQLWNGKALRELDRLDEAMDALSASLSLKPSALAYGLRGTIHYEKRAFDKAIADYTDAIRLDAGNGEAFNNRAWTYYETGHAEKALADADMAVRLLAREAYVYDTRGHIHARLGNRDAAISDFRTALSIDPGNAASKAGLASLGVD